MHLGHALTNMVSSHVWHVSHSWFSLHIFLDRVTSILRNFVDYDYDCATYNMKNLKVDYNLGQVEISKEVDNYSSRWEFILEMDSLPLFCPQIMSHQQKYLTNICTHISNSLFCNWNLPFKYKSLFQLENGTAIALEVFLFQTLLYGLIIQLIS